MDAASSLMVSEQKQHQENSKKGHDVPEEEIWAGSDRDQTSSHGGSRQNYCIFGGLGHDCIVQVLSPLHGSTSKLQDTILPRLQEFYIDTFKQELNTV